MTDHVLLGGAERTRTRVRGFAPWAQAAVDFLRQQVLANRKIVVSEAAE
jgi:hypothetical protein